MCRLVSRYLQVLVVGDVFHALLQDHPLTSTNVSPRYRVVLINTERTSARDARLRVELAEADAEAVLGGAAAGAAAVVRTGASVGATAPA